jgi:hypothetical protein
MSALFSVGFPTGMEGLTYPILFSGPDELVRIAQRAEALGYHSVWGNDHMTTQHYVRAEFPVPPRFWEPLVTYSFLAAHTKTLKFAFFSGLAGAAVFHHCSSQNSWDLQTDLIIRLILLTMTRVGVQSGQRAAGTTAA